MRINEVKTMEQLRDFMTTPTEGLVGFMRRLEGGVMVLGAGGKVGPELVETFLRADKAAGVQHQVAVADLFPPGTEESRSRFEELGLDIYAGDLTERSFLKSLPDFPNVIYMPGIKFGSSKDWPKAFHLNSILPYLVGERYSESAIVVFSSGNPYPHTKLDYGGSREGDELAPQGVYGWGIVARECSFTVTSQKFPRQRICFYRLFYAQHLCYGVLVDLARMVMNGEPISLAMPAVNLISQRDSIDVALRCLEHCKNPPFVLVVAGPILRVRDIVERLGELLGKKPNIVGEEPDKASLGNDALSVELFGPYRDGPDEMIEAAANWVASGGENWGKPTMFGRVNHVY